MILNEQELLEYKIFLILNEAYVGKTPILEAIENKIGELRKKVKYSNANDTLKETLEINRLFEKQFGMNTFALHIYPSDFVNGFTHVIANNFDIAAEVTMHDMVEANATDGYRFKEGNGFVIIINLASQLFTDPQYTNAEILAVMLHELGHNFADAIYDEIEYANKSMMNAYYKYLVHMVTLYAITIVGIPTAIKIKKMLKEYTNRNRQKVEKKSQVVGKGKIKALFNSINAKTGDFFWIIKGILTRLQGGSTIAKRKRSHNIGNDSQLPQVKKAKSLQKQNEVIADKFAGIYGYGPDQASVLLKMEYTPSPSAKFMSKLGKKAQDLSDQYDKECLDLHKFDEHPQLIQRIMTEITLLKNELKNDNADPKLKKVIKDQITQLEEVLKMATVVTNEMSKSQEAQTIYNQFIKDTCPDALEKEIEDKIEKALNDILYGGN